MIILKVMYDHENSNLPEINSFSPQWKMQTWPTKVEMNPHSLKGIVQIYFYILFYNNKVDRIKFRKYQSMIKSRFRHHHQWSHKCCILLKKVLCFRSGLEYEQKTHVCEWPQSSSMCTVACRDWLKVRKKVQFCEFASSGRPKHLFSSTMYEWDLVWHYSVRFN